MELSYYTQKNRIHLQLRNVRFLDNRSILIPTAGSIQRPDIPNTDIQNWTIGISKRSSTTKLQILQSKILRTITNVFIYVSKHTIHSQCIYSIYPRHSQILLQKNVVKNLSIYFKPLARKAIHRSFPSNPYRRLKRIIYGHNGDLLGWLLYNLAT